MKEKELALLLFDRGAIKFGAFRLKLHDTNLNAPLSPFYINLRDENNPKPGPLQTDDYRLIAECMWQKALKSNPELQAIAGIPKAGDPIAQALLKVVPKPRGFRLIELDKEETEKGRTIVPKTGFEYRKGEIVLLIDDLITGGHTKTESIKAIKSQGAIVNDLLVLVDREQGGKEDLAKAGYNLISVFGVISLFNFYRSEGLIDEAKYWECFQYIRRN